jgi:GGDEF domain-containing protein
LDLLLLDMEEKVRQLASVLSLQLPDGMQYVDILAEAHRQLSGVASEAAADLLRAGPKAETAVVSEEQLLGDINRLADAMLAAFHGTAERESIVDNRPSSAAPLKAPQHSTEFLLTASASASATSADPGLLGRLSVAATACHRSRCPLSLLLVELDERDQQLLFLGAQGFETLRLQLKRVCSGVDHLGAICAAYGEAGFAIILPDCERRAAVQLGDEVMRAMHCLKLSHAVEVEQGISLSVGVASVALPLKNFPPRELLAAADRCLYGSRASGGGVVKSIEIY